MREILYRGFHEDADGESYINIGGKTVRGYWLAGTFAKYQRSASDEESVFVGIIPSYASAIYAIDVIPETVGLKYDKCDKNGKPIYVGDIIELVTEDGEKITIVCKFGTVQRQIYENLVEITGFYFERSNDGRKTFPIVNNYLGKHDTEIWEVIGTIFDVKEEAK